MLEKGALTLFLDKLLIFKHKRDLFLISCKKSLRNGRNAMIRKESVMSVAI